MIKARAIGNNGVPVLVIGVSRKDLEPLIDGCGIVTPVQSANGVEFRLLIMGGETDEAMLAKLKDESAGWLDMGITPMEAAP